MRGVRRGFCVLCCLGPPFKVKSNRFAVSRGYESLISWSHRRKEMEYNEMRCNQGCYYLIGLVGFMPLQLLEIGCHVEIHAIEWHDFQRDTQFHGVVVA